VATPIELPFKVWVGNPNLKNYFRLGIRDIHCMVPMRFSPRGGRFLLRWKATQLHLAPLSGLVRSQARSPPLTSASRCDTAYL